MWLMQKINRVSRDEAHFAYSQSVKFLLQLAVCVCVCYMQSYLNRNWATIKRNKNEKHIYDAKIEETRQCF